jgi:hypothetical protein
MAITGARKLPQAAVMSSKQVAHLAWIKDGREERHFVDVAAMRHDEVMTLETVANPYQLQDRYAWYVKGIS